MLIEPKIKAMGSIYEVRQPADPVMVWADAHRLRQVLLNLIANAIRFTPSGGRITAEISARACPDVVYLRVRDTGIGIERQKQERIFRPLRHVATCGGDLRVRSAEGKGSTFTITLRCVTNEAAVDAQIEDDGPSGARNDLPDHCAPD